MINYDGDTDRYRVDLGTDFVSVPGYYVRDLMALSMTELCTMLSESDVYRYIGHHADVYRRRKFARGLHLMILARLEGLW